MAYFNASLTLVSILVNIYSVSSNYALRPSLARDEWYIYPKNICFQMEFFAILLAFIWWLMTIFVVLLAKCRGIQGQEMGGYIDRCVDWARNIRALSLLKFANFKRVMKSIAGDIASVRKKLKEDDPNKSDAVERAEELCLAIVVFGKTCLAIVFVCFGIAAFIIKLTTVAFVADQDPHQWGFAGWVTVLGFLNNVLNLQNEDEVELSRMWKFVFAGADSSWDPQEEEACQEFQNRVSFELCRNNLFKGVVLLVSLTPVSLQAILQKPPHSQAGDAEMGEMKHGKAMPSDMASDDDGSS